MTTERKRKEKRRKGQRGRTDCRRKVCFPGGKYHQVQLLCILGTCIKGGYLICAEEMTMSSTKVPYGKAGSRWFSEL